MKSLRPITKTDIIAESFSTRRENLDESWDRGYNLRWKCGKYTLSIAVGQYQYCHPRDTLDDVSEYTEVECGILNGELMSLDEVIDTFGHGVGSLCEGYDYRQSENALNTTCTVLPYVSWEKVEMVANRMWAVEDASHASGC